MLAIYDPEGDALSYQWYIVENGDSQPGTIISGATGSTYIPDKSVTDTT